MADDINSCVSLNTGYLMPYFGFGCFRLKNSYEMVRHALKLGYRLIDTAEYYGNEEECGRAIRDSGIPREEIFLTSKLWNDHRGYDAARKGFLDSFHKLGLEYIDLYLIHSPYGGQLLQTYDALVDMQKEGFVRSIGVSNFNVHHLEGMRQAGRMTPAVNQIELHAFCHQKEIVNYCQDYGIVVNGYCPVARNKFDNDPSLLKLAQKYNKSVPQILIRWSLQNDYITIPMSGNPAHIQENAEVFDFSLTKSEMQQMKENGRVFLSWHDDRWSQNPWGG